MLMTMYPTQPINQGLKRSIRSGSHCLCRLPRAHPSAPRFNLFQQCCHFFAAFSSSNTVFLDDPETRGLRADLLVCRESYRDADLLRLDIRSSSVKNASVEDHHAAKQRSIDGDERVRSVGKQAQLFEGDFEGFNHRATPRHRISRKA